MQHEPNHKHFTRGGQIAFHNLRMLFQINKALLKVYFATGVAFLVLAIWLWVPSEMLIQTVDYHTATFLKLVGKEHLFDVPYHGKIFKVSVKELTTNPYFAYTGTRFLIYLMQCVWASLGFSCVFAGLMSWYFVRTGRGQTKNHFIRGSTIEPPHVVKRKIINARMNSDITLDGFPLIKNSEVQHLLIHGTVGTGKSQLIMKIMDALRARGDRVIVYDKGCTFMESYFDEKKDVVLNPFDSRCAPWDLWAEAPTDELLENMAESLIPMHGETDPFWVNAARTVFSSTASRMREDSDRSLDKLLRLLLTSEFDTLEPYLKGTPAATLVSGKIEKTAISIRAVVTTFLKSMQSLRGLDTTSPFSIRDYILDEDNKGWLFISSNGEQQKSMKPLISMWIAMASMTLLSLPEDANRRVWFICDELPSLHKLPMLGETIAEVRKFGGCFLLGMQSFSQLEKVYGRSGAAEIFDLLNTRAFFRSPSNDMAKLTSRELGEEEMEDTRENYSYGANSIRDGISLGKNRLTRPLVTYPEIMNMKELTCYIRLPGDYPITKLELKYEKRSVVAKGFDERKALMGEKLERVLLESPKAEDTTSDTDSSMDKMKNKVSDLEFEV